jgi:hypothetical protein
MTEILLTFWLMNSNVYLDVYFYGDNNYTYEQSAELGYSWNF